MSSGTDFLLEENVLFSDWCSVTPRTGVYSSRHDETTRTESISTSHCCRRFFQSIDLQKIVKFSVYLQTPTEIMLVELPLRLSLNLSLVKRSALPFIPCHWWESFES